jgi:hypothetical protein
MHYTVIFLGLVVLVFVALLVIGGGPDNDNDDNPEGGDMEEDDNGVSDNNNDGRHGTRRSVPSQTQENREARVCITRASRLFTYVGIKYFELQSRKKGIFLSQTKNYKVS